MVRHWKACRRGTWFRDPVVSKNLPTPKTIYSVIQPNTLAMELNRIMAIQTGARYFKKKLYSFFRRKAEEHSTSSAIFLKPTTRIMRMQVEKAARGIITELVKKSKKSRKAKPKIFTESQMP